MRRHVEQYYTAGEHIVNFVAGNSASQEDMDMIAARMESINSTISRVYEDGEMQDIIVDEPLWDPKIPKEHIKYLCQMQQLCQQAGAELALVTIPALEYPIE